MRSFPEFFKSRLATPFLIGLILVNFSLLINIPIPFIYEILNTSLILFLILFFLYLTVKAVKEKQVSKLYLIILLLSLVPLFGAFQSMIHFNQPLLYGILAERLKVFSLSGLLLIFLIEKGFLNYKIVEKVIITLAFIFLIVVLILSTLVPVSLVEDFDFVIKTESKGYRIKFEYSLIYILYFFSLSKVILEKKKKYLILILVILFYFIFLFKARSLVLSLLLASGFFLYQNLKIYILLSWGIILGIFSIIIFTVAYWIFPDQINKIVELFISALNFFLGGEITDSSSMSRVSQVEIAIEGISKHQFFGNGFLSSRWQGGLNGLYGHFYPSDIGWVGVMYLYGGVGVLIYTIPFILTAYYSYSAKKFKFKSNSFSTALTYTMLYYFINSATAGIFVKKVGIIMFVFSLVYYFYYQRKTQNS